MKFATIVGSLLAVSTMTHAATLRSKDSGAKPTKAQIVIQGVQHDFSKQDLQIIEASSIAAYNNVQSDSSFTLKKVKPVMYFGVDQCMLCPPDDDAFSTGMEKALVVDLQVGSKQCMLCPPDDDTTVALGKSNNHKLFVESFCNLLATSGSSNLAGVHHCSFTFLEKPGHKVTPLELKTKDEETALGFLAVNGLLHDLSESDIAIIEKETLVTYNEAFANTGGYSLDSIKTRGAVETPKKHNGVTQCMLCPPDDDAVKQCMLCPPDDDAAKEIKQCMLCPPDDDSFSTHLSVGNVLYFDIKIGKSNNKNGVSQCMLCPPDDDSVLPAVGQCMLCPPDDDSVVGAKKAPSVKQCMLCPPDDDAVEVADLKTLSMAFSKALCSRLRLSGSPNLAFADDCSMDFFYDHASSEE